MKYAEFMVRLQEYYGPYDGAQKVASFVRRYIERDIAEDKLGQLFRYVTYSHPPRFGPPGISDIEKAIDQARYRGKGADVHKGPAVYTPQAQDLSDEEWREGKRLLDQAGGLPAMVKKLLTEKRFDESA